MANLVIDVCFMLDVVFNFRTAISTRGSTKLVYSQRMVAWEYITGWFFVDFVSSIPYSIIFR
jgi:hypothetical protein